MRATKLVIFLLMGVVGIGVAGCGTLGGTTAIAPPSPSIPPLTCMVDKETGEPLECPIDRPDRWKDAVIAHGKCSKAWQGCKEEAFKWRAREEAIKEATE